MITLLLILLGVIVIMGIIRVIITPPEDLFDFILDIFFLDLLVDLLGVIIESFFDND